jgi:flagellin
MAGGIIGNHFAFVRPVRARTNLPAQNITNFLNATNRDIIGRQVRMSTGERTLRVEDGAAFYAIARRTEAQVRAKEKAIENIGDAKDLLSLAEAGLLRIDELLGQMRDLTVRAGNDTLTAEQRADIAEEMGNLATAIDEIVGRARFNETDLMLNGNFDQIYQVGPLDTVSNQIRVKLGDFSAEALGVDPESISVATHEDASDAIGVIDLAVGRVKDQLMRLGAIQNELTSLENVLSGSISAEGSIQSLYGDADIAAEQVALAKLQLFNQLASVQAANANALPGGIINSLL